MNTTSTPAPFSKEDMARRRKRALAMAAVLVVFIVLFFITTVVRIGGSLGTAAP